uniref:Uncharacterized protein n=1 Tax=Panagrolaimus sp. ES5 TaxID=591445 RepID=A0AC34GD62_9BILA
MEPGDSGVKGQFFLTSCSHISCQECYESSGNVCSTCKKNGIKGVRIDGGMAKQYRQYFVDVPKVITSKMEEMGRVRKFQDMHLQNLVKGTLKLQDVVKKSQEMLKKYETECKRFKKENQDLRFALKGSTPSTMPALQRYSENSATCDARQRTRSKSPNTAAAFMDLQKPPSSVTSQRYSGSSISKPDLRATLDVRQRTPLKSQNTASVHIDTPRPQFSTSSAPRYSGDNIPKPELRATFDARQRTRSKSPNTALGYMQGTIKKGSILPSR